MLSRAEPTKQKTRRPERRGIARAVSPKKMREEKKTNVRAQERGRGRNPGSGSVQFEACVACNSASECQALGESVTL